MASGFSIRGYVECMRGNMELTNLRLFGKAAKELPPLTCPPQRWWEHELAILKAAEAEANNLEAVPQITDVLDAANTLDNNEELQGHLDHDDEVEAARLGTRLTEEAVAVVLEGETPAVGGQRLEVEGSFISEQASGNNTPSEPSKITPSSQHEKKKAASKELRSFFKPKEFQGPKIFLSEFEREVYYAGIRGVERGLKNTNCAVIGRTYITQTEFSETMRPRAWVGTIAMDVYCEARTYDHSKEDIPEIKKGFLTSAEVEFMKKDNIDIAILKKKLALGTIGFELHKVDMVMIPVCMGGHWLLIIANMRDNRFDVLSSCKFKKKEKQMTNTVRTNFVRVFQAIYHANVDIKVSEFKLVYQDAAQQNTDFDCGIFVMNFMMSWDGMRVAQIDDDQIYNYIVKAAVYMLCHPANKVLLPAVKEIMEKHDGQKNQKRKRQGKSKFQGD